MQRCNQTEGLSREKQLKIYSKLQRHHQACVVYFKMGIIKETGCRCGGKAIKCEF